MGIIGWIAVYIIASMVFGIIDSWIKEAPEFTYRSLIRILRLIFGFLIYLYLLLASGPLIALIILVPAMYVHMEAGHSFSLWIIGIILIIVFTFLLPIKQEKLKFSDYIGSRDKSYIDEAEEAVKKSPLFGWYAVGALEVVFLTQFLAISLIMPFLKTYFQLSEEHALFLFVFITASFMCFFNYKYNLRLEKMGLDQRTFKRAGYMIIGFVFIFIVWLIFSAYGEFRSTMNIDAVARTVTLAYMFYFSCVNCLTFSLYGVDKFVAIVNDKFIEAKKDKISRIPEDTLHWCSICGGTAGAFIGHKFFSHKMQTEESKGKFAPIFNKILSSQLVLMAILIILDLSIIGSWSKMASYLPAENPTNTSCPTELREFVAGESNNFNIYICGKNVPSKYVGVDKGSGKSIELSLSNFTDNKYVAQNGDITYVVTRNSLTITQKGKVLQTESLRVSQWRK
jgi:uncharacterized membrane protein YsdA (DUF1294 family)